jgi:hypothetical protein
MANAMLNSSEKMRTTWKITMPAIDVLAGANEKLSWHKTRLGVWENAREKTKQKIRENGIVIDESVLEDMSLTSTYSNSGRAPSVTVNAELVRDLNETNSKIVEHKDKVDAFESWVQFLESAKDDLELTLSDYLYFFGK